MDVCVYAPAFRISALAESRASWIQPTNSPSWFVWRKSISQAAAAASRRRPSSMPASVSEPYISGSRSPMRFRFGPLRMKIGFIGKNAMLCLPDLDMPRRLAVRQTSREALHWERSGLERLCPSPTTRKTTPSPVAAFCYQLLCRSAKALGLFFVFYTGSLGACLASILARIRDQLL